MRSSVIQLTECQLLGLERGLERELMAEPMPCLKALKYPLKFKYLSVTICKQNIRVISCDLN